MAQCRGEVGWEGVEEEIKILGGTKAVIILNMFSSYNNG